MTLKESLPANDSVVSAEIPNRVAGTIDEQGICHYIPAKRGGYAIKVLCYPHKNDVGSILTPRLKYWLNDL